MLSDPKTKGIQMSQVHTLQMGRLVAAGSKNNLASAIDSLAGLEALHIVDYDDSDEGFSLGTPGIKSEEVGTFKTNTKVVHTHSGNLGKIANTNGISKVDT